MAIDILFPRNERKKALGETEKRNTGVALSLRYCGLTELSESLGKLAKLNALDLRNNHLTTLPDSLRNLSSITILDVRANRLVSLPEGIGDFQHLEKMDVRWNKIAAGHGLFQQLEERGCRVYV
jgi:Leucine-rich repeat (LRR) protein